MWFAARPQQADASTFGSAFGLLALAALRRVRFVMKDGHTYKQP